MGDRCSRGGQAGEAIGEAANQIAASGGGIWRSVRRREPRQDVLVDAGTGPRAVWDSGKRSWIEWLKCPVSLFRLS